MIFVAHLAIIIIIRLVDITAIIETIGHQFDGRLQILLYYT